MFKTLLLVGFAAAALAPSVGAAQTRCLDQKRDNKVVGTIVGAIGGALIGNAIGEGGGREGGTIIGGIGGAVVGNQVAGAASHCGGNQYGYYDANGQWMPNTANANGYYDPNGRWVAAPPPGYAPPPPPPVADNGPLPPPPEQDGYAPYPPPGGYGQHAEYDGGYRGGMETRAPMDTRAREDLLDQKIHDRIANGALDDRQARHALRELGGIRRIDAQYRSYDGRLDPRQRDDIQARLDTLGEDLRSDRDAPPPQGE